MPVHRRVLQLLLLTVFCVTASHAFIDGLYCGRENCYDVLGITRDTSKAEMARTYRQLARKYHPDMHKTQEAKAKAAERFTLIATAYEFEYSCEVHSAAFDGAKPLFKFPPDENSFQVQAFRVILKDDESRKDYDDMLDNPEAIYRHYYRYYRKRMAPKVDIRIVLAVTITVISAVQYGCTATELTTMLGGLPVIRDTVDVQTPTFSYYLYYGAWHRYHAAIDHLITVPKYRLRAMEIAKKEGLFNPNKKKDRRRKEEIKEEEENTLKRILEEQVDIRGGYSKPTVRHVLWIQLVLLPYTLGSYLWWQARWFVKFTLRGEELGMPEKEYLIRRQMALSQSQWDALEERDRQGFFRDELWIPENFKVWKQKQEDEMKAKLAENARYKSYRRYMKNHGPGQITFED